MLELVSLTFNNIRSFTTEHTINFSNRDKIIQIDGKNENTGGSSGAGKTTVFLALDYLLGINDIPTTVLQSRLTKNPISVSAEFLVEGKPVTIKRSKKDGLEIVSDESVSGNVKLAEEKLDEIIGIPRKIFKKMIHKKQKEGGFFLNLTSSEMFEFLITVLNLNSYTEKIDKINDHVKQMLSENDKLMALGDSVSESAMEHASFLKSVVEPRKPEPQEDVEALDKTINEYKVQMNAELKNKLNTIISIPKPVKSLVDTSEKTAKSKLISDKIRNLREDLLNSQIAQREIVTLIDSIKNSMEKKQVIERSLCPTCNQHWNNEESLQKIESYQEKINRDKIAIIKAKKRSEGIPAIEESIKKLSEINDRLKIEISEAESEANNRYIQEKTHYDVKIGQINTEINYKIIDLEYGIETAKNKKDSYINSLRIYEKDFKIFEEKIKTLNDTIAEKKEQIQKIKEKFRKNNQDILVAEEAKRLIKSYILQNFTETLDSISQIATNTMGFIPNMVTSSIYFEGCKETKSGKIKDEVTAMVSLNGENDIPIKSLSGGERTTIDLAVDLAVIDVLESKVGKGASFYVIDEPFDGLDSICKENYLEILKNIDTNKKIIIVDHSSELKAMVTDVIKVVKNGENSYIEG